MNNGDTSPTLASKTADTLITAKAKSELMSARELDSQNIHVTTENGTVTLTGAVARRAQKETAARIVGGIDGVANVRNELGVDEAPR